MLLLLVLLLLVLLQIIFQFHVFLQLDRSILDIFIRQYNSWKTEFGVDFIDLHTSPLHKLSIVFELVFESLEDRSLLGMFDESYSNCFEILKVRKRAIANPSSSQTLFSFLTNSSPIPEASSEIPTSESTFHVGDAREEGVQKLEVVESVVPFEDRVSDVLLSGGGFQYIDHVELDSISCGTEPDMLVLTGHFEKLVAVVEFGGEFSAFVVNVVGNRSYVEVV